MWMFGEALVQLLGDLLIGVKNYLVYNLIIYEYRKTFQWIVHCIQGCILKVLTVSQLVLLVAWAKLFYLN